jgi:hypothetical protein
MLSAASNHQCFPSSSSFNSSFIFVYSSNSHVLVPTKTLLWSMINCQTRIKLLFRYLFFPCLLISSFASSESRVQDILVSFIPIVLVKRSTFRLVPFCITDIHSIIIERNVFPYVPSGSFYHTQLI